MNVRFDETVGSFIVEPGNLPVEFDDRTGEASLLLGDRRIALRQMRWREKVRLARHAGPAGSSAGLRLLRIVLAGTPTELAKPDLAAALAVARWFNGLTEPATALPLEPAVLATVTVELCRSLGVQPADLDERDALDVEALWSALRATAGSEAVAPPDFGGAPRQTALGDHANRIVIVPDSAAAPAPAISEPDHDGQRAYVVATDETPGVEPSIGAGGPGRREQATDIGTESGFASDALGAPQSDVPVLRYRLVDPAAVLGAGGRASGAAASRASSPDQAATVPVSVTKHAVDLDGLAVDRASDPPADHAPTASGSTARARRMHGAPPPMPAPRGDVGPGWTGDLVRSDPRALIDQAVVPITYRPPGHDSDEALPAASDTAVPSALRRSSRLGGDFADDVIEDFGERLERAAAQLGIGP